MKARLLQPLLRSFPRPPADRRTRPRRPRSCPSALSFCGVSRPWMPPWDLNPRAAASAETLPPPVSPSSFNGEGSGVLAPRPLDDPGVPPFPFPVPFAVCGLRSGARRCASSSSRAAVREERRHNLIDVDRSVRGRGARRGDRTPGGDVRGDPSTARRPLSRDGWVRVHVARDELGEFVLHAIVAEFGREVELPPPAFVVV